MSTAALVTSLLQEVWPDAETTALLFEISYLCLGKFPALEEVLRVNAVDILMAFKTSDALLLQCIGTSDNMVTILFPMLTKAVQSGNTIVAVRYLEKAQESIQDIITEVDDMVQKYGQFTRSVASTASEVHKTKVQSDEQKETRSHKLWAVQVEKRVLQFGLPSFYSGLLCMAQDSLCDVHLPEVQQNLSRITQILLKFKSFWLKIEKLVKDLQPKTIAGKEMVDFLNTFKEEFLNSLEIAKEGWINFRWGCIQVGDLFRLKNQDACKFLTSDPSTLTLVEWQQQYNYLKARLENL